MKVTKFWKAYIRLWFGMRFIKCESPTDILIVQRDTSERDWQYTMSALMHIVSSCGHPHPIIFGDANFKSNEQSK